MKPTGRRRPRARLLPSLTMPLLALCVALAACDGAPGTAGSRAGASGSPGAAGKGSPTPTINPNEGTAGGIGDPGATATHNPNATPTPTPTPAQQTTATPEITPTPPPTVDRVELEPSTGFTLNLPAPAGMTPLSGQATQSELTAFVYLNTGALDGKPPTWTSSDVLVATVSAIPDSSKGLVKAVSKTGTATIRAIASDGKASASVVVTVKSTGKVLVGVE